MRIIHFEGRHLASMTSLFKRPRRHGNTTIAPPLLSQNLRRGEENDDDGDDDDGTGGEKEVKTAKPFGIFRRLSNFYNSRREEGELCTPKRRVGKNFGHLA